MDIDVDWERLASQLLRSLRGSRSQVAWSRRLGYRCNVAVTWEAGRRFPTAAVALRAAERAGIDVRGAIHRFYRSPPPWLDGSDPTSAAFVARLLADLRGNVAIGEVARRAGRSRYAVARWLSGAAEPRLPDFLRMIEATSLRSLDLVATLADPATLPASAPAWARLQAGRSAFRGDPRTLAIYVALELEAYRAADGDGVTALAEATGFDAGEVRDGLAALVDAGAVRAVGDRYEPASTTLFDTRNDPAASRRNRVFWTEEGLRRLLAGRPGVWSYNVFVVSEAVWKRIEEMERAHYRAVRAAIDESTANERVGVLNHQLFGLSVPRGGA